MNKKPKILFTGLDPTIFYSLGSLIHHPALRIVENQKAYAQLPKIFGQLANKEFAGILFTSKQAVSFFVEATFHHLGQLEIFNQVPLFAEGWQTQKALEQKNLSSHPLPSQPRIQGLVEQLEDNFAGKQILLIPGTHAPGGLEEKLRKVKVTTKRLDLIQLEPHPNLGKPLPTHDFVYFVSPQGLRTYWKTYGPEGLQKEIWTMGPAIGKQAKEYGFESTVVTPPLIFERDAHEPVGDSHELV